MNNDKVEDDEPGDADKPDEIENAQDPAEASHADSSVSEALRVPTVPCGPTSSGAETHAHKLLATHCLFITDRGGSLSEFAEKLSSTVPLQWTAESSDSIKGYIAFIFDTSCAGESSAHPHLRTS